METLIEPFSAAIVYVADKYVESFPCKEKLVIYLQELCSELDIHMMSIEKPIIMKGSWNTVIQMERFLNTLLSELSQCISREENPNLQNLSQAFAHCSNLFTNKKEILEGCSDISCLSSVQIEATSDLSQCAFHKDRLNVQRKGGHAKNDIGEGETFQEVDNTSNVSENFSDVKESNGNVKPIFHVCIDGLNRNTADSTNISLEETVYSGSSQEHAQSEVNLRNEEKKYKTSRRKSSELQIKSEKESDPCDPSSSAKLVTLRRSKRNIKTKVQNAHKTLLPSKKSFAMPTHFIRQENKLKSISNLKINTALTKIFHPSDSVCETETNVDKKKNEDIWPHKNSYVQKKKFSSAEIKASKSACVEIKNDKLSRIKEKIPSPVIIKIRMDSVRKSEKIEQSTNSKTNKTEKLGILYNCKECMYKTKNSKCLEEHMKRVHLARQFRCSDCDKEFGFRKDLRRHMKCHGKAQYNCEVCGKTYKEANKLKAHKKTHAFNYVKPQFSCQQCSKSFSTKYVLSYHIKSEHLGMKRSFICPTCGKSFAQKNSYLQHANLHKGVKPFTCDVCNMQFSYEKSLKEHASLHDETRNFKCSVCSKTFKQSSGLNIHMRIHNDTKDYVCAVCGREFRQRQALLRHERIHVGEKPFECCLCTKFFGDSSVLRRHMLYVHKRSLKDWQKDTQRHTESKKTNSILVVSDSSCVETKEVNSGNQSCGDDFCESAERKSSTNHVVVQKEIVAQLVNKKETSKNERPISSLFLKSSDQESKTYNFPEGNLQIDLFSDGITPAPTETNPLFPTDQVSETPNLMLSPIAEVIVGPFNKLTSCHSDSANICQTDDIPFTKC